jgi:zinc/manganese transport system substrate-binding protein
VTSIVTSPAADPHDYEPTAADARAFAGANLVIVNGAGYDPWAEKLLAANPVAGRIVLDVGDLVGVSRGGNPHRWYSPADVHRVIARIERDYATLDPRNTDRYASRRAAFESRGLADYHRLLTSIRRRYDGVRVGASESIFSPLARSVGLALATPPSFLNAISEGAEPTAKDIAAIERQIAEHAIAVWVENSQNTTPDVQRLTDDARAHGIPVTTITETLAPRGTTFQQWQSGQLRALAAALAAGRER